MAARKQAGLFTHIAVAVALAVLLAAGPALSQESALLTSLEWPPYTGQDLADQGASTRIVRAAFAAAGIGLSVEFFPWNRAVMLARNSPHVIGYFPEYYSYMIDREFILSERMGESPLVFIENTARPVAWDTLADLAGVPIGTVSGYVNTEEFDRLAAAGRLRVEAVANDETNIRKVAAGRVALAVIDANVFRYLMAHRPDLSGLRDAVRINPRPLETKGLFVCFRRDAQGENLAQAFNQGLSQVDWRRMQDEYFAAILK